MPTALKVDWSVAQNVDLVEILRKELGEPEKGVPGVSRNVFWNCPFHKDGVTPSFTVLAGSGKWHCFGCGKSGDIYDFFSEYRGWSHRETLDYVLGCARSGIVPLNPKRTRRKRQYSEWGVEEVEHKTQAMRGRAEKYFGKRGISPDVVRNAHIGGEVWHWTPSVGQWKWGETVKRVHFTIPNIFNNTVKSVKCRRDDDGCKEALSNGTVPDGLFTAVLERLTRRYGKKVTEDLILDSIFGPRFMGWRGGNGSFPYNLSLVATQNGSEILPRRLSYVIITEAEIDALYLMSYTAGKSFPAVAMKPGSGLNVKKIFSGVTSIIVVADNDETGRNNASKLVEELGRGRIIIPPVGKDANDVPRSMLAGWLSEFGAIPVERGKLWR
jgi:hypothetical protein